MQDLINLVEQENNQQVTVTIGRGDLMLIDVVMKKLLANEGETVERVVQELYRKDKLINFSLVKTTARKA